MSVDWKKTFGMVWALLWLNVNRIWPYGYNIYDSDWDLLIILDCCRVDALQAVSPEYEFLPETIKSSTSVGSTSKEWVLHTFRDEYQKEIADTIYVSGNPYRKDLRTETNDSANYNLLSGFSDTWISVFRRVFPRIKVGEESFRKIVDVRGKQYSDAWGFVPPAEATTDYTITAHRQYSPERCIAHYMQPHQPYIYPQMQHGDDLNKIHNEPFAVAKRGSEEDVWDAYLDNLRYVLDDISRLLANIDAEKVVITSDHGELFGEWGLYSHHVGVLHPALRKVPWVETTASDTNSANPDVELSLEPTEPMEEHLEALGYR